MAGAFLQARLSLQIGGILVAIIGLIWVATIAFRWALADVYATQVSYHLDTVDSSSSNKNAEQWRLARQQLDYALERRASYAPYFELAERFYDKVHELETYQNPLLVIRYLKWTRNETRALEYCRQAISLAPSNPYVWGQMMVTKLKLLQFDSELAGAIERAVNLGPWIGGIQYRTALAGLSYWPFLQEASHRYILQAIDRVLAMNRVHRNAEYDIDSISNHKHIVLICSEEARLKGMFQSVFSKYCS